MMRVMNTTTEPERDARPYVSLLRERQMEQTRELIFQALTEQLAEEGIKDFNIPRLSRRAGVSVRTIYRYFPSKDALLDALDVWMDDHVVQIPPPRTTGELARYPEQLFAAFDENASLMLAQFATPPGREIRARGRRRRLRGYAQLLAEVTANLDAAEATGARAVISYLVSAAAWKSMREEFGLAGEESGAAVAWAIRTLIADLKRRNGQAAGLLSRAMERGRP